MRTDPGAVSLQRGHEAKLGNKLRGEKKKRLDTKDNLRLMTWPVLNPYVSFNVFLVLKFG